MPYQSILVQICEIPMYNNVDKKRMEGRSLLIAFEQKSCLHFKLTISLEAPLHLLSSLPKNTKNTKTWTKNREKERQRARMCVCLLDCGWIYVWTLVCVYVCVCGRNIVCVCVWKLAWLRTSVCMCERERVRKWESES